MSFLKEYLGIHAKFFRVVYRVFLLSLKGRFYSLGFNIRSLVFGRSVRIVSEKNGYVVIDSDMPLARYKFYHEKQGNMAYERGLVARAEELGKVYFFEKIEFSDGDMIFDCGANVGDIKLWFDLKGLDVRYVGFEPSPIEFKCLKENVKGCDVYNVGLWNEDGQLDFFVSSQGADSSLIEPAEYDEKVVVEVKELSHYMTSRIKLLKLEAEGAEPEILEGLGGEIMNVEYVSADLGFERGKDSESTLVPVTNFLLKEGFDLLEVGHGRVCALYKNNRFNQ